MNSDFQKARPPHLGLPLLMKPKRAKAGPHGTSILTFSTPLSPNPQIANPRRSQACMAQAIRPGLTTLADFHYSRPWHTQTQLVIFANPVIHAPGAPNSEAAQQAAAVAGLHAVAGERRMDRILPDEFREQWRGLDEQAVQRKEREQKQAERRAAAAKRPLPPRVGGPVSSHIVFPAFLHL